MRKRIVIKGGVRRDLRGAVEELSTDAPNRERLYSDLCLWLATDLNKLPAFLEDGSVAMYEVGGLLLGKQGLIRLIERFK